MGFAICLCVILTLDIFTIFFGAMSYLHFMDTVREKNDRIKELEDYVKELEEAIK